MKVTVNHDACVGCGACTGIAEDVFELNDEGLSEAKVDTVPKESEEAVKDAIASCPTSAIEEVEE